MMDDSFDILQSNPVTVNSQIADPQLLRTPAITDKIQPSTRRKL